MGINIELAKSAERVAKKLKALGKIPNWYPLELAIGPAYDLFRENPEEFERLAEE